MRQDAQAPAHADIADGDGGRASPGSVGHILRQHRVRAGYGLPEVAGLLKIRRAYLEAIEDGRFQDLPGAAYASGFVRSYGELFDLDVGRLVTAYKAEQSDQFRRTKLVFPTPQPDGRMPGAALLFLALIFGGFAYGGWYYATSTDRALTDLLPDVPERWTAWLSGDEATGAAAEAEAPAETAVYRPAAAAAEDAGVAEDAADEVAATESTEPAVPVDRLTLARLDTPSVALDAPGRAGPAGRADPAGRAGPADRAGPAGRTTPADDRPTADEAVAEPGPAAALAAPVEATPPRIVLHATGLSWVQVRDGDGRLVMTRVLQPGERYEVPPGDGLLLDTGNAGALALEVDGTRLPVLGGLGEVVRDISLDAEALSRNTL